MHIIHDRKVKTNLIKITTQRVKKKENTIRKKRQMYGMTCHRDPPNCITGKCIKGQNHRKRERLKKKVLLRYSPGQYTDIIHEALDQILILVSGVPRHGQLTLTADFGC